MPSGLRTSFLFIILLGFICYFTSQSFFYFSLILFLVRHFVNLSRPFSLFIISLFFSIFLFDSFFSPIDVFQDAPAILDTKIFDLSRLVFVFTCLAFVILIAVFQKAVVLKFKKLYKPHYFIWSLAVGVAIAGFNNDSIYNFNHETKFFLIGALCLYIKLNWGIVFFISPQFNLKQFLHSFFLPFYSVIADRHPLVNIQIEKPISLQKSTFEILPFLKKYSLYLLIFLLAKSLFIIFYFDQWSLSYLNNHNLFISESYKLMQETSGVKLFIMRFLYELIFYVSLFFVYGEIVVLAAHFAGHKIPPNTQEPWRAESFKDFFFRSSYYYSHIILNFFYYPFRRMLYTHLKNHKNLLSFLSLFTSLVLGGMAVHVLRGAQWLLHEPAQISKIVNSSWAYFTVFAVACLLVNLQSIRSSLLRFGLFMVIYSLLRLFYAF